MQWKLPTHRLPLNMLNTNEGEVVLSQHKPNHNDTHIHNDTTMTRNTDTSSFHNTCPGKRTFIFIHTCHLNTHSTFLLSRTCPQIHFHRLGRCTHNLTGTVSQRPTVHIPPPDTQEIRRYIFYGAPNTYDTHILHL
jgi:hypothetical protein